MSRVARTVELILLADGGAELVNFDVQTADGDPEQLWASDSDEEFQEEFPDLLDENDIEHVLDYLVAHDILTDDEADTAEISAEPLGEPVAAGPGDEEDEDDEDDGAE